MTAFGTERRAYQLAEALPVRGTRADLARIGLHEPLELLARITRVDDELRADVAGVRVISDERNDLALTVTDPFAPVRLTLDAQAVLRALGSERLRCRAQLAAALTDPARLRAVVLGCLAALAAVTVGA